MSSIGGVVRYTCPLPACEWQRDVLPDEGPQGVELAMREHVDSHSILEYLRALVAAQKSGEPQTSTETPLVAGDVLHGFCGGIFGRDHYECCRVETVGRDWVVVRADDAGLGFAVGTDALLKLRQYRTENDYCPGRPCPVQPREA